MNLLQKARAYLSVPIDRPELVIAQCSAFSRQIPLLYLTLLVNIGFVSLTHWNLAPEWLVVDLPLAFAIVALTRLWSWWKLRHAFPDAATAASRLRVTNILATLFGVGITLWGHLLFAYGSPYSQAHVLFFMAITFISCSFCLMHLRAAVFTLAVSCLVPFTFHFGLSDIPELRFVAANMIVVTAAMIIVILSNYNDFSRMVAQQKSLLQKQEETQQLSDENRRLADRDSLTGLSNRRGFFNQIETEWNAFKEHGKAFSLALFDLDGFKSVNDLYGHALGDQLLAQVGKRLELLCPAEVLIARLGGDEFGLIFPEPANASENSNAICGALAAPFHIQDIVIELSASCGILNIPDNCDSLSDLMEFADSALYVSKANSEGKAVVFSNELRDQLRKEHAIEYELRNGDLASEMTLVYQPIVKRETGKIKSFEALARWNSPALGPVPPLSFITAAERSGLINKITLVLFDRLLEDLKNCPKSMVVSFNLSARSLTTPGVMLKFVTAIHQSKVDPTRIEFEVTETSVMKDFDGALRGLSLLHSLGCRIALDDFGTGYSSLSYVHRMPLHKIKIDRRFVLDVESNSRTQEIVRTIVALSRNLRLDCVVEGVETEPQANLLSACGCSLMQGYLYSKPIAPCDALALLETDAFNTQQRMAG